MDFPKSVPNVGLVGGKFVDENPVTGTPGSLIPAQWGNSVTTEILGVIQEAGLVPDEADNTQLLDAIKLIVGTVKPGAATEQVAGVLKLATQLLMEAGEDDSTAVTPKKLVQKLAAIAQAQTFTAFTTTGTASAFMLAPLPAITAYSANQRFQVKFHIAGGATPTLNVSGMGGKSIKQYSPSGSKVAAIISAGLITDVVYDGTDMVVLDATLSVNQATETLIGGGTVATQPVVNAGVDDTSFVTAKKLFAWVSSGVSAATEAAFGYLKVATQAIVNAGADDSMAVTPKKLRFGFTLNTNLIAFPSWLGGFMIQWGVTSSATVTFSQQFPNSLLSLNLIINNFNSTGVAAGQYSTATASSTTGFTVATAASGLGGGAVLKWIAFGN